MLLHRRHGNYYPVKFSFDSFNPATSALRDHPDPSTHTVLNVPLNDANSLVDFVVFKGRYDIGEESFRPPYVLVRNTPLLLLCT